MSLSQKGAWSLRKRCEESWRMASRDSRFQCIEEMAMDELKPCFGCGALFPAVDGPIHPYLGASAGCWAVYGEVLAREYGEYRYPAVHRLTVDTYSVQHLGIPSRRSIQSVAVHLVSLWLILECRFSSEKATAGIRAALGHRHEFVWLAPPSRLGDLTILDVCNATDFVKHKAVVKRWAESVWQAWSPHHETVRRWAGF
jgi:hypothetical protein